MKDLDFRKQLIINEFKTMSKGKSKEEILPLLLALSTKAKQAGVNFTKEDTLLIIEQVKDELTEQERQMLPQILALIGK
ncbi:hypothetical protein [Lachnospira hominis (ex Hitch et al. 2024)]|jgi:hypothetical protein|uniref:Uncharacterized protein n=1 Tax=Lachnospira intestinalis TaxID=3133158 RepID=A0ABV1GPK8_9FIRM